MTLAVAAPLLCVFAFLMAAMEIEIEGPYGWAQNLPTPYRVSGPLARAFGAALGGKPLTGYNLLMFTATLVAFHLPFAFGTAWTAVAELTLLAAWVAWSALWDFLWFLLNPAYGWRLFLPGSVWWHARWLWRLPLDYWVATGASLLLAFLAQTLAWGGAGSASPGPFAGQVLLLLAFIVWAVVVGLASPLYARLYRHTHAAEFDERGSVRITPPPGTSRPAESGRDEDELPWQE